MTQNQNDGVGNNPITSTRGLRSMFQHHGNQVLKFHLIPYLTAEERSKMRGTCKTIEQHISKPQFSYFRTKRYMGGDARARIEQNTGFVETRGHLIYGGDSSAVRSDLQSDVKTIFSTCTSFAALKTNGKVVVWGDPYYDRRGGSLPVHVSSHLQSGVKNIVCTMLAFAALKTNGRVITWGFPHYGGNSSSVMLDLQSDVKSVISTEYAFAALKTNGRVINWGEDGWGGDSSNVSSELQSDVKSIVSTKKAFAVLKSNGKVITWGHPEYGGDSSNVSEFLQNGVIQIESIKRGIAMCEFRATKSDGTQIQWPY